MISLIFSAFFTNLNYLLVGKILFNNSHSSQRKNFFEFLIYGFIITSFVAVSLNFFTPLSKAINTSFFFLTVSIFFFLKKKIYKYEILKLFIISILLTLFIIFDTVNRPDAMMYHLPFSKILNEEKIIIGLSNLHFRFSHISILQYSSSINNNYLFGENGILIPLASIYIFLIVYFFSEVYDSIKEKNFSISKFFIFIIIIFIGYKINRYSKIGNDDIGHLISFLIIYKFLDYKKIDLTKFKEISLLSVFLLANKFSLILFCLIAIFIFFQNIKYSKKILVSLPSFFLIIWCIKNILISGCYLYPIEQTCIKNLDWINIENVKKENIASEAWAKDWPNFNQKKVGMNEYIRNFNWFDTWSNNHLKKILKNITPLLIISIILILFNFTKTNLRNQNKEFKIKFLISISISILGSLLFFLKFPLYRYGYSYVVIFIALFFSLFFNFQNKIKISKIFNFFLIFCVIILFSKQLVRYYKYYNVRPLMPRYVDKNIELQKKYINQDFVYYYNKKSQNCWYNKSPCTFYEIDDVKFQKLLNYKLLLVEKN
ncbi:LIC_10190 family membrane protein [Candidatus Pelagibacter sp. HIMB1695]|uniref:LIC_10190 family membrane protein n=1 Tax=Candidatus Pelagibacter sp. HIMB1695 TaxID=3413364 RepID=UPI003F859C1F